MAGRKARDHDRFQQAFRMLGERIARHRRDRHLTQERLADEAGLSTTAISDIERADSCPSLDTLFLIARALGLTVAQLLEGLDIYVKAPSPFADEEIPY